MAPRISVFMYLPERSHFNGLNGWMDGWMDGRMDGWMGGWMDGWMDGWEDGSCKKGKEKY